MIRISSISCAISSDCGGALSGPLQPARLGSSPELAETFRRRRH